MKHLLSILTFAFASCATLEKWQANPAVHFAETQAIKLAESYFDNGGNSATAWGVSAGLQTIGAVTSFYANQNNASAAVALKQTVTSFADDPTAVNGLANGLASVVVNAAPKTASERANIALALASGIQKAAGLRHD